MPVDQTAVAVLAAAIIQSRGKKNLDAEDVKAALREAEEALSNYQTPADPGSRIA